MRRQYNVSCLFAAVCKALATEQAANLLLKEHSRHHKSFQLGVNPGFSQFPFQRNKREWAKANTPSTVILSTLTSIHREPWLDAGSQTAAAASPSTHHFITMVYEVKDVGLAQWLEDSDIRQLRAASKDWRAAVDSTLTRLRPVDVLSACR